MMDQATQILTAAWVMALQVLAMLAALGALVLVLAAECWVGRNMLRGWRDPSGWRGMVAVAADLDARDYGPAPARPVAVGERPR